MAAGPNTGTGRRHLELLELYADYKPAKSSNRQLERDLIEAIKFARRFDVRDYDTGIALDDTVYMNAAILDAQTTGGAGARVHWRGNLNISGQIAITGHRIHVWGWGRYASTITFNPAVATALFKPQAANPAQVIFQGSFGGFSLIGGGVQQKIGFDLWDSSEFMIEDIAIQSSFVGNSGSSLTPSMGIRTNGREVLTVRRADIFTDRPIHIRVNPNSTANETCDHFHFTDLYFATQVTTEAGILIDANCAPSNLTFDGYQAWIGGTYGLDYTAGGTTGIAGTMVTFHNIRYEQAAVTTGYAVRWQGQSTQNLQFISCHFGGAVNNGTYMRNVQRLGYTNCTFAGGGGTVAHDWTTCDQVWLFNTFSQVGSTVVLGTLEEVWSLPFAASTPHPETIHYIRPDLHAIRSVKVGGIHTYFYKGTVASGAFLNLPLLTVGNGLKTSNWRASGYSATGPIEEGGSGFATAASIKLLANSANFAGTNVGGKLCMFFNSSGNPMVLLNNTAQSLFCLVGIEASYG